MAMAIREMYDIVMENAVALNMRAVAKPAKTPIPPKTGMGVRFSRRALGLSTMSFFSASFTSCGCSSITTIKDMMVAVAGTAKSFIMFFVFIYTTKVQKNNDRRLLPLPI
jgi:hypothetical protein